MTHHADAEAGRAAEATIAPPLPARPASVELAAAILIVGGVIGVLAGVNSAAGLPAGLEPFLAFTIALGAGSIVVGVLVRFGRLWILAVNYVAVLGFLDLMASGVSPLALMLGVADLLVVGILLVRKPWFDELAAWRAERAAAGRPLSP